MYVCMYVYLLTKIVTLRNNAKIQKIFFQKKQKVNFVEMLQAQKLSNLYNLGLYFHETVSEIP